MANKKTKPSPELDALLEQDAKEVSVSADSLAKITSTAHDLLVLEARIRRGEELLKELTEQRSTLRNVTLPALMDEAGVKDFTLDNDMRIMREEEVYASIAKANRAKACAWLCKNGYDGIVKNEVNIELPRGASKEVARISALLKKAKVRFELFQNVHHSTLLAFVKESLAEGRALPPTISQHVQPCVSIKPVKK